MERSPALVVGVAGLRGSRRGQEQLHHPCTAGARGEANQSRAAFAQRARVAAGLEPRPHRFDVAAAHGLNDSLRGDHAALLRRAKMLREDRRHDKLRGDAHDACRAPTSCSARFRVQRQMP